MTVERLAPRRSRSQPLSPGLARPRLGFLGVGWIGLNRLQAMADTGLVEVAAVADPSSERAAAAAGCAAGARQVAGLDELLGLGLDGVVIATPSAQHAGQAIRALEAGLAVFCQKPLGRSAAETQAVVDAARAADRLLGVDLSYRHTEAMRRIRDLVGSGELGRVFALDLVFHNAYGPDKAWFYDPVQSGGGCVIDLGVHLVDLALWMLDFPGVGRVSADLLCGGEPLARRGDRVEDYAVATLDLDTGAVARIACSWNLHAGCEAQISASVHGVQGGAAMRNVGGSFYNFTAERFRGCERELLAAPPDDWGGRAARDWAVRLAAGERYDPGARQFVQVAEVLDRIYRR